ncbi:ABC transporter substrate-binding protein, partial [Cereibacter changlensis JA139]
MFIRARLMATAAIAALTLTATGPLLAATPDDTIIQAYTLDDIISLDPAEVFEFTASEIIGNSYEPLIGYELDDVSKIFGVVAESWELSEDGMTMSFKIREGKKFASGNDLTAEDVVFSLVRGVKLDKSPAFILGQFGLTAENVDEKIKQTGDY